MFSLLEINRIMPPRPDDWPILTFLPSPAFPSANPVHVKLVLTAQLQLCCRGVVLLARRRGLSSLDGVPLRHTDLTFEGLANREYF
jgi:hypothetical protein